jgi:hypothetical protein
MKYHQVIDVEDFNSGLFNEVVRNEINKYRHDRGIDSILPNQVLNFAAEDQSEYMAENEYEDINQSGKKKDTRSRLIYYGGSGVGRELVEKLSVKKGKDIFTYQELGEELVFKWLKSSKTSIIIADPLYVFIGQGTSIDYNGKKIYISCVFGNYRSFNEGANRREELDVPFTKKKHGLKPLDSKICKKCKKVNNIEEFQKGIYVKDGLVYFKTDDLKKFKRFIRQPKDGIAVDVVQKIQYPCIGDNIINNENPIKGIPTKKIWSNKIYKKNLITDKKQRRKKLDVCIGKFPKKLLHLNEDEYELNLLIIQNKHICRNIHPYFDLKGDVEYNNVLDFLADTITVGINSDYTPEATDNQLKFRIPFEKAKYTYEKEDIEPFLESLNEPEFTINELNIHAYSSVEGSEAQNEMLQKKRAESIIKALNERQKSQIGKTNISTSENFEQFKADVQGTEFSDLASMTIHEVQNTIRDKKLNKKLEPILSNHRYADITMNITYEIDGDNEQAYVVKMFNDAIANYNKEEALAIQKYIFKKVVNGDYDAKAVSGMNIPESSSFAGILMNKVWLERYVSEDDINEACCEKITKLSQLDPGNDYIRFNNIYCSFLEKTLGSEENINLTQEKIDALYETTLSKPTIDLLNLEFQFRIIDTLGSLDEKPDLLEESLTKIKEIVDLEESNWQNSLKLAYIFIRQNDYEFAAKLLEPFVEKDIVFEELVYLYLSLCSRSPERIYSNRFVSANKRAYKLNPERYCQLFDGSKFSVQVLENTQVKKIYCEKCNK